MQGEDASAGSRELEASAPLARNAPQSAPERTALLADAKGAPELVLLVDADLTLRFINRAQAAGAAVGKCLLDFVALEACEPLRVAIHAARAFGRLQHVDVALAMPGAHSTPYSVWITPPPAADNDPCTALLCSERRQQAERAGAREREEDDQLRAKEREALRRSEAQLRTLVEYAPEALMMFDAETGHFVDVNARACALFGLSREALLQAHPGQLSPEFQPDGEPSQAAARRHIEAALAGNTEAFEWTHLTSAGAQISCEVRLVRMPHEGKSLVRGTVIDIGYLKQAEAERARLREELAQAQKIQALGQLTGGIAHDFNNLLTVVMSHAELLEVHADRPERIALHARGILEASRRAASLTQQLLAFARRQPLRPQVVDLELLLLRMEDMLRRTLGETIEVRTQVAGALWPCEVDPIQLENAVLNLAINARDAMPQGGSLQIELANEELPPGETQDGEPIAAGPYVVLRVADTGAGMSPEVRARACEPFFTTKEVGRGSGLGLSMVYGFVRQSGGHLEIDSEIGKGTRVALYLPRTQKPAQEWSTASRESRPPRGEGQLVLVVEDDPEVRRLTVGKLESLHYCSTSACDATSGLEAAQDAPELALLLSDVALPGGISGVDLARMLRARTPSLPVVLMSGYPTDVLALDGEFDADFVFLQKPFSLAELAQAVDAALRGRKYVSEGSVRYVASRA